MYVLSSGTWNVQQILTASDGAGGDLFGHTISDIDWSDMAIAALSKDHGGYTDIGKWVSFKY